MVSCIFSGTNILAFLLQSQSNFSVSYVIWWWKVPLSNKEATKTSIPNFSHHIHDLTMSVFPTCITVYLFLGQIFSLIYVKIILRIVIIWNMFIQTSTLNSETCTKEILLWTVQEHLWGQFIDHLPYYRVMHVS